MQDSISLEDFDALHVAATHLVKQRMSEWEIQDTKKGLLVWVKGPTINGRSLSVGVAIEINIIGVKEDGGTKKA